MGSGAYGEVYRAIDPELDRPVAIKVARADRVGRIDFSRAEAKALAGLRHPGIIGVYDIGRTDDGRSFIVSEYVEGTSLDRRMKQGPVPLAEALAIVSEAALALHYAHKRGFVHRDIKPANILLDKEGHARVADFGLALHEDERRQREGEVCGTPAYMAPEQIRGDSHRLDGRADLWALGVVLYELITGRRPFTGATRDELEDDILNAEPRPPRMIDDRIPLNVEQAVLRCLEKKTHDRCRTGLELAQSLAGPPRPARRSWLLAGEMGLGLVALAVFWLVRPRTPITDTGLVESFRAVHYRDRPDQSEPRGEVGTESRDIREGDAIRVQAAFRRQVSCYLIAFNADGAEQLCFPADEMSAPSPSLSLDYPDDTRDGFYLTDGSGQQAFVLVVSESLLPSYRDWRAKLGPLPWKHFNPCGIGRFDGQAIQLIGTQRGTVGKLKGMEVFGELCRILRERSEADAIQAVCFSVHAKR